MMDYSSINSLADGLLAWVLEASLLSAGLLAIVSAVWLVLRKRSSAHLGYALFLVPLLPLLPWPAPSVLQWHVAGDAPGAQLLAYLPAHEVETSARAPGPATALSSAQLEEPAAQVLAPLVAAAGAAARRTAEPAAQSQTALPAQLQPTAVSAPSWKTWLGALWALVVAALLIRFLWIQLRTRRVVAHATPLDAPEAKRVAELLMRMSLRAGLPPNLAVVQSAAISSPAVWGVRRPTLLLPPGLVQRLDEGQLAWVLLHELAHVARKDLWVSTAQRVLQILWFFNPFVWLTNWVAEELRECACDEAALATSPNPQRRRCAEALLEVIAGRLPRPTARLGLQTLHNETTLMKKRILRLIDPDRTARCGLTAASLPLLVALGGLSLASVQVEQASTLSVESLAGQEPQVRTTSARAPQTVGIYDPAEDDAAAQKAVAMSLQWLIAQQKEDGHWPTGPGLEKDAGEFNAVGITGFVLLTLMDAQQVEQDAERSAAITSGLRYLSSVHDASNGLFGEKSGLLFLPSHAVALQAWLRAGDHSEIKDWKTIGQRAVSTILQARNPYGGWRYDMPPVGDNDSFNTSLMLITLAQAKRVGLKVSAEAVQDGLGLLDSWTDPDNGRTGYNTRGGPVSRLAGRTESFPTRFTEMTTSMAIVARLEWGQEPMRNKLIRDGAHLVSECAPLWSPFRGTIDYYHWLWGTEALSRLGGYPYDHWRDELLRALVPNQVADKAGGAWWPAIDAWSEVGATVHSTALNTLALQRALR